MRAGARVGERGVGGEHRVVACDRGQFVDDPDLKLEDTQMVSCGRGSAHTSSTHNRKVGSHSVPGGLG